jgi:hypothetical protein
MMLEEYDPSEPTTYPPVVVPPTQLAVETEVVLRHARYVLSGAKPAPVRAMVVPVYGPTEVGAMERLGSPVTIFVPVSEATGISPQIVEPEMVMPDAVTHSLPSQYCIVASEGKGVVAVMQT